MDVGLFFLQLSPPNYYTYIYCDVYWTTRNWGITRDDVSDKPSGDILSFTYIGYVSS